MKKMKFIKGIINFNIKILKMICEIIDQWEEEKRKSYYKLINLLISPLSYLLGSVNTFLFKTSPQ